VRRGANSSGDSDSIATIAGSIAGALMGARAIDSRFLSQL
jgi:ADP-ribosylglycohydrolase